MGNIISTNEDITFVMPSESVKLAVSYESDYIKIDGNGIVSATDLLKSLTAETPVDLIIPSTLNGITVTDMTEYAFSGCPAIRSVTISEGNKTIGKYAFNNCPALTSVTLPDSLVSIQNFAFLECISLASIIISDGIKTIYAGAFWECTSLSSITIGKGVTSIQNNVFTKCASLTSIEIPANVNVINDNAFYGCTSLTSINIHKPHNSIKGIPWGAPGGSSIVNWLG